MGNSLRSYFLHQERCEEGTPAHLLLPPGTVSSLFRLRGHRQNHWGKGQGPKTGVLWATLSHGSGNYKQALARVLLFLQHLCEGEWGLQVVFRK